MIPQPPFFSAIAYLISHIAIRPSIVRTSPSRTKYQHPTPTCEVNPGLESWAIFSASPRDAGRGFDCAPSLRLVSAFTGASAVLPWAQPCFSFREFFAYLTNSCQSRMTERWSVSEPVTMRKRRPSAETS